MAILSSLKTALLGDIEAVEGKAALDALVGDIPAEYKADAEIADALRTKRAEYGGQAAELTDSEILAEVAERSDLRDQILSEYAPEPADAEAEPAQPVLDNGVLQISEVRFSVSDEFELADDHDYTTFELVAKDTLETLREAQASAVTDERLESLRGIATSLGAEDADEMDFQTALAYVADNQDGLRRAPADDDGYGFDDLADFYSGNYDPTDVFARR